MSKRNNKDIDSYTDQNVKRRILNELIDEGNQQITNACINNDIVTIRNLIARGGKIMSYHILFAYNADYTDLVIYLLSINNSMYADILNYAIQDNKQVIIGEMLKNIPIESTYYETHDTYPLTVAAKYDDIKTVTVLLSTNQFKHVDHCFIYMCRYGHLDIVQELYPSVNILIIEHGLTEAIKNNHKHIIDTILEQEIEFNMPDFEFEEKSVSANLFNHERAIVQACITYDNLSKADILRYKSPVTNVCIAAAFKYKNYNTGKTLIEIIGAISVNYEHIYVHWDGSPEGDVYDEKKQYMANSLVLNGLARNKVFDTYNKFEKLFRVNDNAHLLYAALEGGNEKIINFMLDKCHKLLQDKHIRYAIKYRNYKFVTSAFMKNPLTLNTALTHSMAKYNIIHLVYPNLTHEMQEFIRKALLEIECFNIKDIDEDTMLFIVQSIIKKDTMFKIRNDYLIFIQMLIKNKHYKTLK
jgi:hypothetical protein